MANFAVETTEKNLKSLEAALGAKDSSSLEELLVSVTISAGISHERTYHSFDGIMALLALGEIDKMKGAVRHLKHFNASDKIKGNSNAAWAAKSAYEAILGRYFSHINIKDSISLRGLVSDFEYVQRVTGFEPEQGIHDQILSNISNVDKPERFFSFLFITYVPYVNSREKASLSKDLVQGIYSAMINENHKRSLEAVTRWYQCTGILPQINGNNVSAEVYIAQKVGELKKGS